MAFKPTVCIASTALTTSSTHSLPQSTGRVSLPTSQKASELLPEWFPPIYQRGDFDMSLHLRWNIRRRFGCARSKITSRSHQKARTKRPLSRMNKMSSSINSGPLSSHLNVSCISAWHVKSRCPTEGHLRRIVAAGVHTPA